MPDVPVLPPDPAALWAALVPAQREVLRHVAAAAAVGGATYLVGGPVRDLLLGATRLRDIDVMATTDARLIAPVFAARIGGAVEKTTEFGTATVTLPAGSDPASLDLATTRTETYARPGALPTVAFPASFVEDDLRRRDVTINAMALPLTPGGFGSLVDPFDGLTDLRSGMLRVLHNASFRDDPTRLFRLARYTARYRFAAAPQTATLAADAVAAAFLDALSPTRKRREIELGMREGNAVRCLAAFDAFGLLAATSPALVWDSWVADRIAALTQQSSDPPRPLWPLWAAFVARDGAAAATRLVADADLVEREVLVPIHLLMRAYTAYLAGEATPATPVSALVSLFEKIPEWVVPPFFPEPTANRVAVMYRRLRAYHAAPHLDGDAVQALGVKRGPELGVTLQAVRAAWLNGELQTPEDERQFVRGRVTDGDVPSLCK